MMAQQRDLFDFGGQLAEVRVVEFGRGVTLWASGNRGEIRLRCEPVDRYLHVPAENPCGTCEHHDKCADITGCPMAEAWHRAWLDYAEATKRKDDHA
jgi:hypothetical protein